MTSFWVNYPFWNWKWP